VPKHLDQVTALAPEHVKITGKRICDASHIRTYVSSKNIWRRGPLARRTAGLMEFAAT
jgi:hypothetical protein